MADLIERLGTLLVPMLPGFIAGYVLGRVARKALRTALLIGVAVGAAVFLLARFGVDTSAANEWLRMRSTWAGDRLEGFSNTLRRYCRLRRLLPWGSGLGWHASTGAVHIRAASHSMFVQPDAVIGNGEKL